MAIIFLIPILILMIAAVGSYFVSKKAYASLVAAGNKYPKAISSGIFILSFAVIACVLLFLFFSSVSFER